MGNEIIKPLSKRKPFRILGLMDEDEIHQFGVFISGAMFVGKPDQQLGQFFAHCRQQKVWRRKISREAFLAATGLPLTQNTFDKLVSRLYQHLMNYIGMLGLLQQPAQVFPFALKYLSNQSVSAKEIEKKVAESQRVVSKLPPNAEYFRASLDLHLVRATAAQSRTERPEARGLHRLHDDLDGYYYIQKLRFLCASLNEQLVFQSTWEQRNLAPLMALLDAAYSTMPTLAQAYYHAYYVLKGMDYLGHFEDFRRLLSEWEKEFGQGQEITDLYFYLLNFFIIRYNNGDLSSLHNIDRLFEDLLERGTILDGGRILPEYFINMIKVKCRLSKTDEARHIFNTFGTRLTDPQDGAVLAYSEIFIQFYEQRFTEVRMAIEAMLESPDGSQTDMFYGLDLRCILLKTYFCQLEKLDLRKWDITDERFRSLLRSFRTYIERKQISQMSKVRFENFRKALKQLYFLRYLETDIGKQTEEEEALLKSIKSSSNLPDKGWLIAQLQPQN